MPLLVTRNLKSRRVRTITLIFVYSAIALAAEGFVRTFDLDWKLLGPLLYYEGVDLPVHRVSENTALHYELLPNSRAVFPPSRVVTINSLGFRDEPRSAEKAKGVFRIVCFGGSNTFGASVSDEETYPRQLERLLNRKTPGRYEVWNAGVHAYNLFQNVAMAKSVLERYSPDLLIFQPAPSNCGRRPFLLGQPFKTYFDRDPSLFTENLRFLPAGPSFLEMSLMRHCRLYRAIVIAVNHFTKPLCPSTPCSREENLPNLIAFEQFYRQYKNKMPILLLLIPSQELDDSWKGLGIRVIDLAKQLPPNHRNEYELIHPPSYVYSWYARELRKTLQQLRIAP